MQITEIINDSCSILDKLGFTLEDINKLEEPNDDTLKLLNPNQISNYFKILNTINDLKSSIALMNNSLELLKINGINQEPLKSAIGKYFKELSLKYSQLDALTSSYNFIITYSKDLKTVYGYTDKLKGENALRLWPLKSLKGSEELKVVIDMNILSYLIKYNELIDINGLLRDYSNKEYILELTSRIRRRLKEAGEL